jgi:hypothetical protein
VKKITRKRPSPAFVVAMLALFISLSATAAGLPGRNRIDGNDLRNRVVGAKNIKRNAVGGFQVKPNSLGGAYVRENTLGQVPSAAAAADSQDVLWGVINVTGGGTNTAVVERADGVTSATYFGNNTNSTFRVTFNRDITGCAYFTTAYGGDFAPPELDQIGVLNATSDDTIEVRPFEDGTANWTAGADHRIDVMAVC